MPVLHQMQVSGNCYKVRLVARQLGIPLRLRNYGLHDGTTRQADFSATLCASIARPMALRLARKFCR